MVVSYNTHIHDVHHLRTDELPRSDAHPVQWLVPGFINAHCHLEYTWLGLGRSGLPRGPVPFGQWMEAIMAARPGSAHETDQRDAAMAEGAKALLQGGCTTVIDSTTDGSSEAPLGLAGLRHFLLYEALGLSYERAEPIWQNAMEQIKPGLQQESSPWLLGRGINPHASYSVGAWLRQKLLGEEAAGLTQAWHLAETPDEDELFQNGEGSIAAFLKARKIAPPFSTDQSGSSDLSHQQPPGISAFEFLLKEDQLRRCQVAFHGNTLTTHQAAFFSGDRGLVHCPATHRWFARAAAPLRQWLDAGVNVCLGTDSLASSDTLSMLDIVRITLLDNPDLSANDGMQMACTNPAQLSFAHLAEVTGRIQSGSAADFVALNAPGPQKDWRQLLTQNQTTVDNVWIAGCSFARLIVQ